MKPTHDSMRGWFGAALHEQMEKKRNIHVITADLGYGLFDAVRDDYPDRFLNCGAAEQLMLGIGIGMAFQGRIPFLYSITPFLLYRPFEWIRNYVHHERVPVKLIGSGLDDDYKHDGITHHAFEAKAILATVPNIKTYFPATKDEIPAMVAEMAGNNLPCFMALRR